MSTNNVRFMYNGIKVDGKLYKAWYSPGVLIGETETSITVYSRDYSNGLPKLDDIKIKNDTDSMTDYFETDSCVIRKGDKYWADACAAVEKLKEHNLKARGRKAVRL